MIDLPPAVYHDEVPRSCVVSVVNSYRLPPELIGGLLYVEGGRKGMANRNTNGSYDYGPAQVNSAWLSKTEKVGIGAEALQHNVCANLWAAGWIMRRCLDKFTSFWHAVGCYHTGENPKKPAQLERQRAYAVKVYKAIEKTRRPFLNWLNGV